MQGSRDFSAEGRGHPAHGSQPTEEEEDEGWGHGSWGGGAAPRDERHSDRMGWRGEQGEQQQARSPRTPYRDGWPAGSSGAARQPAHSTLRAPRPNERMAAAGSARGGRQALPSEYELAEANEALAERVRELEEAELGRRILARRRTRPRRGLLLYPTYAGGDQNDDQF